MPSSSSVILSGYYGFGNLGDDLLFEVLTARLREAGFTRILVPAGPCGLPPADAVEPLGRTDFAAGSRALKQGAVLVSGGGGLLQDRTSLRSLGYYLTWTALARRHRRPYVIAFQSLGPLDRRLSRAAARWALRGAVGVTVRDSRSARLAAELGVADRVTTSLDPVFALSLEPPPPGEAIALCLRPTRTSERDLTALAAWLTEHCSAIEQRFIPCADDDLEVGRSLAARVPTLNIVRRPNTAREFAAALAGCHWMLAQRLHAAILAVCCGLPCAVLDYDPKVRGLADDVGLPVAGDDLALEPARLAACQADLESRREAESRRLRDLADAGAERTLVDARTLFERLASADSAC